MISIKDLFGKIFEVSSHDNWHLKKHLHGYGYYVSNQHGYDSIYLNTNGSLGYSMSKYFKSFDEAMDMLQKIAELNHIKMGNDGSDTLIVKVQTNNWK